MTNPLTPPCLAVAGHHRSGTSLVASMLQSAGVDIGKDLLGPGRGNERGHFEDMGFLQFHMEVLTANGLDPNGYIIAPRVGVPEQYHARARHLVDARAAGGVPWGWKEPRTTLFLDFWAETVPELKFLLLFRAPWEVLDSLFRRGDASFRHNPNLAARVWINYNNALVDFQERHPARCLLLEAFALADRPEILHEEVHRAFGLHLAPGQALCDRKLFRRPDTDHDRWLLGHFFPEAVELYGRLRQRSAAVVPLAPHRTAGAGVADWALQHWVDARDAQREAAAARAALTSSLADARQRLQAAEQLAARVPELLGQLQAAEQLAARVPELLGQLQAADREAGRVPELLARLQVAEGDGAQLRLRLQAAEGEADRLHARLRAAEGEADGARTLAAAELAHARDEVAALQASVALARWHIAWMESSRWWRMRLLWHKLRRRVVQKFTRAGTPVPGPEPVPSLRGSDARAA